MPFTLSHPAMAAPVWPLVRRQYLPLCALAIGTMAPDFEYLWRLQIEWRWSHTLLGVFYFCLPVGFLALGVWVFLLRTPTRRLFAMAPAPLSISGRWWILAALAIVLGALTHIAWDGFTHGFGWATNLWPGLRRTVRFGDVAIPVFNLLQLLSTAIGGLVVLAWLVHEVRRGTPRALGAAWRIAVVVLIGTLATLLAVWNARRAGLASDYWTTDIQLGRAAVGALLGVVVGLAAYSGLYRLIATGSASQAESS